MKKEKIKISWAAAAVCFLLLLFGVTIYSLAAFRGSIRYAVHQDPLEAQRYSAYYVLIAENGDNLLWSSVYKGAKQEGMENGDACVEFFGNRLFSERTAAEKLRMAIDAGVDGIILNGGDAGDGRTGTGGRKKAFRRDRAGRRGHGCAPVLCGGEQLSSGPGIRGPDLEASAGYGGKLPDSGAPEFRRYGPGKKYAVSGTSGYAGGAGGKGRKGERAAA